MAECEKYKSALRKMFKELGMACVIFERNFRTQHLQIQVRNILTRAHEHDKFSILATQAILISYHFLCTF